MSPSVLLIGLPWASLPDAEIKEYVRKGLEQTEQNMQAAGYDYQGCYFHPNTDGRQPFIDALKSREWDAVIIGFGVRGDKQYTEFFEWLVNEIRTQVPGAKLGFNSSPESTMESAKRLVPL